MQCRLYKEIRIRSSFYCTSEWEDCLSANACGVKATNIWCQLDTLLSLTMLNLNQSCGFGFGRIGIFLADPDPYPFQPPNLKHKYTCFQKFQYTVQNTENTFDVEEKDKQFTVYWQCSKQKSKIFWSSNICETWVVGSGSASVSESKYKVYPDRHQTIVPLVQTWITNASGSGFVNKKYGCERPKRS